MSGLYAIKPWFVRSLERIEDRLVAGGVSADTLSYAAVAVSALAGCALAVGFMVHPAWWFAVAPLALVRLALNALDGSVARRTGMARPFGKVINEISDRLSDVFFIAPLALFVPFSFVLVALVVTSITSTCGLLGDVVGHARLTQGPMGKADRSATLAVAALAAGATNVPVGPFAVALTIVTVGGMATVVSRVRSLRRVTGKSHDVR